jgi:D-serine deaminase-like pyridoxal phosphate-dependent protein
VIFERFNRMRMSQKLERLASPAVLIDADKMEHNLRAMQEGAASAGVELWPHIKTHKLVPVLRRQLDLGAAGATCAKLGEAEAMLPSGVRRIFLAHALVDFRQVPRLKALAAEIDELILAVTSELHCAALAALLEAADLAVPVLMAVDTGLDREGARSPEEAARLAACIRQSSRMKLIGIYTHEGHAYSANSEVDLALLTANAHRTLIACADAAGGDLPLWPGCSVTAAIMARTARVHAVRPGSYVFGDLYLAETTGVMPFSDVALTILATVVDRPRIGLALIDAGSKVFSSDRSGDGLCARCVEFPSIVVKRLSEEHGFLSGPGVDNLPLGRRLRFVPAHVCPTVNLAAQVHLVREDSVLSTWTVDARGRSD